MKSEKTCIVCSKKYEYCGHCNNNPKLYRWKNNYCSENCRDIFKTVTDYVGKMIDIKEAKNRLQKSDLNIETTNQINKYIIEILSYEEPIVEKVIESNKVKDEQIKPRRRRRRKMEKVEE